MAKKLFETKNRDESHRALEYVLGHRKRPNGSKPDPDWPGTEKLAKLAGKHPKASCMEEGGSFTVWDETFWERGPEYEKEQVVARENEKQGAQTQAEADRRMEELMQKAVEKALGKILVTKQ